MDYKVADINKEEIKAIKKAEELVKSETGKEFVMLLGKKLNSVKNKNHNIVFYIVIFILYITIFAD